MTHAALRVVLCAAVGLVAACGDDESGERLRPENTGGGAPGVGVGDRDADLGIRDFEFSPPEAVIPAGASVEWTNRGDVAHTVTWSGGEGERFDSGRIAPGENYRRGFAEPGAQVRYRCTIHPRMRGTVRVGVGAPND